MSDWSLQPGPTTQTVRFESCFPPPPGPIQFLSQLALQGVEAKQRHDCPASNSASAERPWTTYFPLRVDATSRWPRNAASTHTLRTEGPSSQSRVRTSPSSLVIQGRAKDTTSRRVLLQRFSDCTYLASPPLSPSSITVLTASHGETPPNYFDVDDARPRS